MKQTCENGYLQLDEDFIISVNEVMDKLDLTTPDELDSFQDAVDYFSSLASVMNTVWLLKRHTPSMCTYRPIYPTFPKVVTSKNTDTLPISQ